MLASGALRKTRIGLDLDITAKAAGSFAIGQRVRAPVIQAIDGARTRYSTGRDSETERFYPYNWKSGNYEGVAEQNAATANRNSKPATTVSVDLALPGVLVGRYYFVQASDELSLTDIVTSKGDAEVRLMLTSAAPSPNGDDGSIHRSLQAGERVELPVLVATDLKTIDDEKWGSSPPMSERMADVPFKEWAAEGHNLSPETYRMIAKQLAGGFDSIVLRTMAPEKWVADIFKAQGLRVYLYQYWAAVRFLDKKGHPAARRQAGMGAARDRNRQCRPRLYCADAEWRVAIARCQKTGGARLFRAGRQGCGRQWLGRGVLRRLLFLGRRQGPGRRRHGALPAVGDADCISFAYGRAKMLLEVKQAIKQVNPAAKLGVLSGLRYVDQLHIADYVSREAVNVGWVKLVSQPFANKAEYGPRLSAKMVEGGAAPV